MADYWFKPHAYGFGATPANWKGWAAVGGYLMALLALALPLRLSQLEKKGSAAKRSRSRGSSG